MKTGGREIENNKKTKKLLNPKLKKRAENIVLITIKWEIFTGPSISE
jgi:hypothetical protein